MENDQFLPVAATINTDSYGRGGEIATQAVFRVVDRENRSAGTGFLHSSGNVITAHHVVKGGFKPLVILPDGRVFKCKTIASDEDLDIAVLSPNAGFKEAVTARPLRISDASGFNIGTQISTWGYPGGYSGAMPMLSVGVLAGVSGYIRPSGSRITQWVVNAAFNSGNSGGPLLHIETGHVIGVVSSKLAPISPEAQSALNALANNRSGVSYSVTMPDGTRAAMSEGQIVAGILNELREQVQLVIGMAVLLDDLRGFLKKAGMDP